MELEEVSHRFKATTKDDLQELLTKGANREQLEAANDTNKRAINKSLESYIYSSALNLYESIGSFTIEPLRVVLIGLRGSGKSSTGNTILGKSVFPVDSSAGEVTTEECVEEGSWNLSKFIVVDTPGSWNPPQRSPAGLTELHALVVNLTNPRFDKEQLAKLRILKDSAGRPILKNKSCVLLLTYAREALQGTNLVEYVHDINGNPLEELISMDLDGMRVMALNNVPHTEYEDQEQRDKLMSFLLGASGNTIVAKPNRCSVSTKRKVFLGICILIGILIIIFVAVYA